MTTPHEITETVPDSIAARDPMAVAHIVQRDRVRASIMAVPDEPAAWRTAHAPRQDYQAA